MSLQYICLQYVCPLGRLSLRTFVSQDVCPLVRLSLGPLSNQEVCPFRTFVGVPIILGIQKYLHYRKIIKTFVKIVLLYFWNLFLNLKFFTSICYMEKIIYTKPLSIFKQTAQLFLHKLYKFELLTKLTSTKLT